MTPDEKLLRAIFGPGPSKEELEERDQINARLDASEASSLASAASEVWPEFQWVPATLWGIPAALAKKEDRWIKYYPDSEGYAVLSEFDSEEIILL